MGINVRKNEYQNVIKPFYRIDKSRGQNKAGVGLGLVVPAMFHTIASFEYASVNLVVAVFIWVMIYPMMVNIDFASLKYVGKKPKGLFITLVVNWLIKPFTMMALGILFFEYLFVLVYDLVEVDIHNT